MSYPSGVTVDGSGNVYIAEDDNLVKVPWTGNGYGPQSTLLSGVMPIPADVAVDGSGNVFFSLVELPWTGSGYGK